MSMTEGKYNFVNPGLAITLSGMLIMITVGIGIIIMLSKPDPTAAAVNELKKEVTDLKSIVIDVNMKLSSMQYKLDNGFCKKK